MNKTAIVASLTENYKPGLIAMLNSFFTHNIFDGDIIIYKLEEFDLCLPWKNVKYINLYNYNTEQNYRVSHSTFNNSYNANSRLEIFKLDYDNIIFIDTDIIFTKSIMDILQLKDGIYACNTSNNHLKSMKRSRYIDAGFLIIGNKFLNSKIYDKLKTFCFSKTWRDEEEMLNDFFINDLQLLDKKYNTLTHEIRNNDLNNIHAIQYVGEVKPWQGNNISECFNEFTITEILNNNKNGLLLLQKLKKLYEKYAE